MQKANQENVGMRPAGRSSAHRAGCLLLLCVMTAVGIADTPAAPAEMQVFAAEGAWQASPANMVLAVAPSATDFPLLAEKLGPAARERGALLALVVGGDEVHFPAAVQQVVEQQSVRADNITLVCAPTQPTSAWDLLSQWTWQLVLRQPTVYGSCLVVDGAVPEVLEPVPGQAAVTPGRVVLLCTKPERAEATARLQQALERWGLQALVRYLRPEEVSGYLAPSLTALLPPSPTRTELTDPVTGVRFTAPPGWHLERRDGYLAIALPDGPDPQVAVEIVTGTLGPRTFEGYISDVERHALSERWIELGGSSRLSPPQDPVVRHRFDALDRRGGAEQAIAWYLIGSGDRIVSLRGVGSVEALAQASGLLDTLARSVAFP